MQDPGNSTAGADNVTCSFAPLANGTAISGGDLGAPLANMATPAQCCAACQKAQGCAAFTWSSRQVHLCSIVERDTRLCGDTWYAAVALTRRCLRRCYVAC